MGCYELLYVFNVHTKAYIYGISKIPTRATPSSIRVSGWIGVVDGERRARDTRERSRDARARPRTYSNARTRDDPIAPVRSMKFSNLHRALLFAFVVAATFVGNAHGYVNKCHGKTNSECTGECEIDGFIGDKECEEVPAKPPRLDLAGVIHVAVNGSDVRLCGFMETPCASLMYASRMAAPGDTISLHGGVYKQRGQQVTLVGNATHPILVTAYGDGEVVFRHGTRIDKYGKTVALANGQFLALKDCHYVEINKIRFDGRADTLPFRVALREHFWDDEQERVETVGYTGIAVIDGSTHITVSECVIHDMFCIGINWGGVRYATARYNILYRIGHHCLVGGYGMKWGGMQTQTNWGNEDPDDDNLYRVDLYGNIVADVEQRIYSWGKPDNTMHMALDEGKSLQIKGSSDTNAKFRVAENLVLYPGILGFRFEYLPNLLFVNNSVYIEPDDRGAGAWKMMDNQVNPGAVVSNNAVFSGPDAFAKLPQPDGGDASRFHSNYVAGGGELDPNSEANKDAVKDLGASGTLFSNPANLTFSIDSSVPPGVGVSPAVYAKMMDIVRRHNLDLKPTCYRRDHERLTQMILANIPRHIFDNPRYVPDPGDPGVAKIYWDASDVWSKKYAKYKKDGLIMTLSPHYAAELIAWKHDVMAGYINRTAKFPELNCSMLSETSECGKVNGCVCEDGVRFQYCKCVNDGDYDPNTNSNRNPVSPVPCVGEDLRAGLRLDEGTRDKPPAPNATASSPPAGNKEPPKSPNKPPAGNKEPASNATASSPPAGNDRGKAKVEAAKAKLAEKKAALLEKKANAEKKRLAMLAKIKDAKQQKKAELLAKLMEKGKKVKKLVAKIEAADSDAACAAFLKASKMDPQKVVCTATVTMAASARRRSLLASPIYDTETFADPDEVDVSKAETALKEANVATTVAEEDPATALATVPGVDKADLAEFTTAAEEVVKADADVKTAEAEVKAAEAEAEAEVTIITSVSTKELPTLSLVFALTSALLLY